MTWGGTLRPEGPPTEPGLRLSPHTRASGKEALGPSWTSEQRDGKSGSVQHTRVSVMGSLCPPTVAHARKRMQALLEKTPFEREEGPGALLLRPVGRAPQGHAVRSHVHPKVSSPKPWS